MSEIEQLDGFYLYRCNESELITIALQVYGIRLRRGLPKEAYVAIAGGYADPAPEQLSGTIRGRQLLERTIFDHIETTRSQLPGCTGRCTTYPCSDARFALCYSPNDNSIKS